MDGMLTAKQALAVALAREAGALLLGARNGLTVEEKGQGNWVTNADRQSEELIAASLRKAFPEDRVLGEENGGVALADCRDLNRLWIIDPLDGTSNYVRGFDHFAVSIAYWDAGLPQVGVVFAPARQELFAAVRGRGAFFNQAPAPARVSDRRRLADSFVGTGIPYEPDPEGHINLDHIANILPRLHSFRCLGASALDLAYVALGRLDGFWEYGLAPWDVAAGTLLVREAGGRVTGFRGEPADPFAGRIVASNGLIHEPLLQMLSLGKTGLAGTG